MATVRLEHITRQFDRVTAIEDITFTVPDGEFWVLVGASGCGKSTILRTIAGLETATSGDLYFDDLRANDLPARQRDVAMVFQNYALYPHMTVAENLSFGLRMRQADPHTIRARIDRVASILDIRHLLNRKPKQLSGGQQQRVALGRAIAREPQAFLLDEPLSNLDAQLREDTRAQLKALHQQLRVTTIYVTHDQTEAMTLGDRLVVLDGGRIQQIGTPLEIYERPANRTIATFLGSPPTNVLYARYDGSALYVGDQQLPAFPELVRSLDLKPGTSIELGVRPEDVQLSNERQGHLCVEVSLIEPLGRETLIRGTLRGSNGQDSTSINFFAPARVLPKPGDRLWLEFSPQTLLAFDPSSGQTCYFGSQQAISVA